MVRQQTPPRLHVIFAREAHEAVIFRRGPAAWCQVIRWDTQQDKFDAGAWIRGRIYPEKCDLSPDGILLLTFIHQGHKVRTSYTDSWNAVSRSPWLEALGLWPQGTTYGGGGRFIDNRSIVIRNCPLKTHADHPGIGLQVSFGDAELHLIEPHDVRSGLETAAWSCRDQRGRLVYAQDGRLMLKRRPKEGDLCLVDFNDSKPDPQPAPEWAGRPLAPIKNPATRKKI